MEFQDIKRTGRGPRLGESNWQNLDWDLTCRRVIGKRRQPRCTTPRTSLPKVVTGFHLSLNPRGSQRTYIGTSLLQPLVILNKLVSTIPYLSLQPLNEARPYCTIARWPKHWTPPRLGKALSTGLCSPTMTASTSSKILTSMLTLITPLFPSLRTLQKKPS